MTSVQSNFNFLCGRPHGDWPPSPRPHASTLAWPTLPPPCGRHKWMAPFLCLFLFLYFPSSFSGTSFQLLSGGKLQFQLLRIFFAFTQRLSQVTASIFWWPFSSHLPPLHPNDVPAFSPPPLLLLFLLDSFSFFLTRIFQSGLSFESCSSQLNI